MDSINFGDIFVGKCPVFEASLGPIKALPSKKSTSKADLKDEVVKEKKKRNRAKVDDSLGEPKTKKKKNKEDGQGQSKAKKNKDGKDDPPKQKKKAGETNQKRW